MTLQEIIIAAIADFEQYGYDSQERLEKWEKAILDAMRQEMVNPFKLEQDYRKYMKVIFDRLVTKGSILKSHSGMERFTLQNIAPRLHSELDRAILASAQLIKLNRARMQQLTLQRFSGWATSIPKGGSRNIDKIDVKQNIAKPIRQLPFLERRVLIDQGHKLTASINAIVATDSGAIAAKWFSHWRQAGYDYREDHKERDGLIYLVRNSWAHKAGLVKVGRNGYSDSITQPAEEVYCRCRWSYIYNIRKLDGDMITVKGREYIKSTAKAA